MNDPHTYTSTVTQEDNKRLSYEKKKALLLSKLSSSINVESKCYSTTTGARPTRLKSKKVYRFLVYRCNFFKHIYTFLYPDFEKKRENINQFSERLRKFPLFQRPVDLPQTVTANFDSEAYSNKHHTGSIHDTFLGFVAITSGTAEALL